jgi:hypothetical protein
MGVLKMFSVSLQGNLHTLKSIIVICMIAIAAVASAADKAAPPAPAPASVKGTVLEVIDVQSFTYLRLKTKDGETWAAVNTAPIAKGAAVTIEDITVMTDFESKSLKRTFPKILFGKLPGAGGGKSAPAATTTGANPHGNAAPAADLGDVKVPKATGPNARTVAEIVTKGDELKDKPVLVRGKVVKFNPEIMGKNWVHLRDGSGSAKDETNDVLVTTAEQAKVGDVVTMKGVVRVNKDFGAGYSYKVIIEEATLQK